MNAVGAGRMPNSAAAIPAAGRSNAARPEAAIRLCHQCASLDRVGTTRGPGLPTARAMARAACSSCSSRWKRLASRSAYDGSVAVNSRPQPWRTATPTYLTSGDQRGGQIDDLHRYLRGGLARGPVSPLIDGFCARRRPFGDLNGRVDRPSRLDLGGMARMGVAWRASSLRGNCYQPRPRCPHSRSWANPSTAWDVRIERVHRNEQGATVSHAGQTRQHAERRTRSRWDKGRSVAWSSS